MRLTRGQWWIGVLGQQQQEHGALHHHHDPSMAIGRTRSSVDDLIPDSHFNGLFILRGRTPAAGSFQYCTVIDEDKGQLRWCVCVCRLCFVFGLVYDVWWNWLKLTDSTGWSEEVRQVMGTWTLWQGCICRQWLLKQWNWGFCGCSGCCRRWVMKCGCDWC